MWGTERTGGNDVVGEAGDRVDFSDGDLFGGGKGREEIGGGASEKGLSGAWRAGDENVMVAGDCDREGAFGEFLTADVVKNRAFYIFFIIFYNKFCIMNDSLFAFEMEEKFAEVFDSDKGGGVGNKGSLAEIF